MISVKFSQEQNPIHSHFHDNHQLIYVTRGVAQVTVNGKEYMAKAGTLVLISRLESHEIQIKTDDYCRYTVQIDPQIVRYGDLLSETLVSVLTNRPEHFLHILDLADQPQVQLLLEQMAEESQKESAMKKQMLLFLLGQLLVLCCRTYPGQLPENTRNLKLVQQMQNYIEKHMAEKVTWEKLAEHFSMSQSYLAHLFKEVTGSSIMAYLTNYRLLMAKHYLAQTDWEISKIVEACGFSDNSNFSRSFKVVNGISPSGFRNQYQGK